LLAMICSFGVRRRTIQRLHGEHRGLAIEPGGHTPRQRSERTELHKRSAEASWVDPRRACPTRSPIRSSGLVWGWTGAQSIDARSNFPVLSQPQSRSERHVRYYVGPFWGVVTATGNFKHHRWKLD